MNRTTLDSRVLADLLLNHQDQKLCSGLQRTNPGTHHRNRWEAETWDETVGYSDLADASDNFDGRASHLDERWTDAPTWEDWAWADNFSGEAAHVNGDAYETGASVPSVPSTAVLSLLTLLFHQDFPIRLRI